MVSDDRPLPSASRMPSYFGGSGKNDKLYIGLVILVIIIAAAYWYFYVYAKACTLASDCSYSKALSSCVSGKCTAMGGTSTFTPRLGRTRQFGTPRKVFRGKPGVAGRSRFNSDSYGWPQAGSLTSGDQLAYGGVGGYNVTSFDTSYDQSV